MLEKSNKLLLMFKALKRKPNANTATATQNDTSIPSMLKSRHTTAVNCMDLSLDLTGVSVLQSNNNYNSSNAYTEIDLHDQTSSSKPLYTPTNPPDPATFLRFLFNDINSMHNAYDHDHDQSKMKVVNAYVNEPFTNLATQMEIKPLIEEYTNNQCFYEIDSSERNASSHLLPLKQTDELNESAEMQATITQSIQANDPTVVSIRKAFDAKQMHTINEGDKISSDVLSKATVESGKTIKANKKSNFKMHFKFKFKTGSQFFKDTKVRPHIIFLAIISRLKVRNLLKTKFQLLWKRLLRNQICTKSQFYIIK